MLLLVGCDVSFDSIIPPRPPLRPLTAEDFATPDLNGLVAEPSTSSDAELLADSGKQASWEAWDAFYFGRQHVGYNHVVVRPDGGGESGAGEGRAIDFSMDTVLVIQQGRAKTIERLQQAGTESAEGQLLNFQGSFQFGPSITTYQGNASSELGSSQQLKVETIRGTKKSTHSVDWKAGCRGLVAIEQSLRRSPLLEKGKTRSFQMLLPRSYQLGTVQLMCRGEASVPLLGGQRRKLTEVQCAIFNSQGQTNHLTLWIDNKGAVIRSYSAGANMVSYRVDQAAAKDKLSVPAGMLLSAPVSKQMDRPSAAKRLAFEITPLKVAKMEGQEKEAAKNDVVIEPAPGQIVRTTADGRFQVVVTRDEQLNTPGFKVWETDPTPLDRRPNSIVDANHPLVRQYANSLSRELSEQTLARELTRTVHDLIELDPQAPGLQSAGSVARDGRGGTIGRAVLLAAMLRARRIPARVAFGLRYHKGPPTEMVFHAWVIAHVSNKWRRLDVDAVAKNENGIDFEVESPPDRLTLVTSTLSEADPNQVLMQMLIDVGRMKIKIMRAQY